METPICVAGSQACCLIVLPLRVGVGNLPRGIFPFVVYPPQLHMKLPRTSYSPEIVGPSLLSQDHRKGCFMPIAQVGHLGLPGWCFSCSVSGLGRG